MKRKLAELDEDGVRYVPEMQRHVKQFVKHEVFCNEGIPSSTNQRFHPSNTDVRNHMYTAQVKLRLSNVDQENLQALVEQWRKERQEDLFLFRSFSIAAGKMNVQDEETQSLLFVHQTKQQQQLLQRYGNDICLLDATYKTTRYSLPLFFLAVKTNVDYQIVGAFVTQNETTHSIKEALNIIKGWNATWMPGCFITDYCEQEIGTIEELFPCTVVSQYFVIMIVYPKTNKINYLIIIIK